MRTVSRKPGDQQGQVDACHSRAPRGRPAPVETRSASQRRAEIGDRRDLLTDPTIGSVVEPPSTFFCLFLKKRQLSLGVVGRLDQRLHEVPGTLLAGPRTVEERRFIVWERKRRGIHVSRDRKSVV